MSRVCAGEQFGQGLALGWGHAWDGFVEVCLVFRAGVFGLEQQDQLGREVRDAALGVVDDVVIRNPDRLVASADPSSAAVRFAEHVEQVVAGGRVP